MSLIKLAEFGWNNAQDVMSKIDFKNKMKGIKQNQMKLNFEGVNQGVRGETSPSTKVVI